MGIDTSSFLLMTGALAAGAVGGYHAHQRGWLDRDSPAPSEVPVTTTVAQQEPSSEAAAAPALSTSAATPTAAAPQCDDSQGTVPDCPPLGLPTEEGGCGNLAHSRCQDFKATMKPRVAEVAVQCLRDLKPAERCDKARVALCGHLALQNACPEATVDSGAPAADTGAPPQGSALTVDAVCQSIVGTAGPSRLAPSLAECRQTLAGLNDTGRQRMLECMRTSWSSKGLLGCEAIDASKRGP